MHLRLTKGDLERIGATLGAEPIDKGNNIRYELEDKDQNRKLALEIFPDIEIGKRRGTLVSVYTPTTHLQLHFCTTFVSSDMLGEVTFVGESGGRLSGLTIERTGGCSLYANVDRSILSGDFTTLGPEVMLSGIALSLTETVLPEADRPNRDRPQAAKKRRLRTRSSAPTVKRKRAGAKK
jgi:hypothetical protein